MTSNSAPKTAWIITPGTAGHELPCIGVCAALGIKSPKIFKVNPKGLYKLLAPWGPCKLERDMTDPYPDLILCTARQSVPYGKKLKNLVNEAGGKIVFLQNPVVSSKNFDLVWCPMHDNVKGDNIISTLTSPHHLTSESLSADVKIFENEYAKKEKQNIAVIIGGPNKVIKYLDHDIEQLISYLKKLSSDENIHLMLCPSRRTPKRLIEQLDAIFTPLGHIIWKENKPNPYKAILGLADKIIVTSDSVNMVGEVLFTGKPAAVYRFVDTTGKFALYLDNLYNKNTFEWFEGQLPQKKYQPIDATKIIAHSILDLYK